MKKPVLSPAETMTPTVQKIVESMERRLGELRRINDRNLDALETSNTRGRIAELKRWVRDLTEAKPQPLAAVSDDEHILK